MNNCKEKQEIKSLEIRLDSKISSPRELDNILKIILNGLLIEDCDIKSRYPKTATLEAIADKKNKCTAMIRIEKDIITVSGSYPKFCKEIRKRIREILELEG
jgi:hypothetical protein